MDYVNKSPIRKPKQRYKNKNKNKNKVSLLAAFVAVSVIAVVIGFNIYTSSTAKQTASKSEQSITKPDDNSALPIQPKPTWVYPTMLQQEKPISISKDYETPDSTPHQLRCGAFKRQSDAQNLKIKISKITPMNVSRSGSWYVVTSPYLANKRNAEDLKNQIKKKLKVYNCILRQQRE